MKERGLGTPATRAAVIEGLLDDKYIVREGKELVPTAKGIDLLRLLSAIGIEELTSPELTGEWEYKLNRIERGLYTRARVHAGDHRLSPARSCQIKGYDEDKDKKAAPLQDPVDGQKMCETLTRYESRGRQADDPQGAGRPPDGRGRGRRAAGEAPDRPPARASAARRASLSPPSSRSTRRTRSSSSSTTTASAPDGKPLDISKEEPLGISPVDGTRVFETLTSYVCESALAGDKQDRPQGQQGHPGQDPDDRENMKRMLSRGADGADQGIPDHPRRAASSMPT